MKHTLSRVCGALSVALLVLAPIAANAQAIQYRDADGVNNDNVSVATPLPVTVSGGGSNAAASATGSAVPSNAGYNGINVGGGTLRGQTGVNPSGSIYAGQTDTASIAGTTTATGNGTTNAGTQRVTLSSDGTGVVGLSAGTATIGAVNGGNTGGCSSVMPISQTASTDLHTATGKTFICSIILIVPDAEVVSLVEGTGSTCATGVAALLGATTAANGMSLSANGGFTATSAMPWLAMQTASDHLCLLQSGSGRIAGVITYNDH